ncbi:MAG TPA: hypothetical protein VLB46_17185 [Pyrinomonadaceae bacterium]|nr:hypothetical protein [Pyrinomonadaceae bacterium]
MNTRGKFRLIVAAVALLPLFVVVPRAMGQQEHPYIIFVGTVEALNAVTLQSMKASENTSVVVVEKVLKKPDAVTLVPRDRVTVVTNGSGNPLQKGVRGLFVTDGLIYGETLAVRLVSWEPAQAVTAAPAMQEARATAKLQELTERDLRSAMNSVDMVVVGRVKQIQAVSASELVPGRQRISEHDPDWKEAIIEVQETLKGPAELREVVVRFPASTDIMWVGYPKFSAGQERTLLLREDSVSGAPRATFDGRSVTAYMATTRKAVLAKTDSEMVKRVLNSNQ